MVFGLILILMMIYRPQGIIPSRRRRRELTRGRAEAEDA
jgi:branched-chain amino acid transport system permease protein